MGRDAKVRAIARALQPKTQDMSVYRQRSSRDNDLRVKPEVAAGILAFASLDKVVREMVVRGDPLPGLLLELKYAERRTEDRYARAHAILVHRYGGASRGNYLRKPGGVIGAIAMAALIEWVNDTCAKCRGVRREVPAASPCLDCGQRWDKARIWDSEREEHVEQRILGGYPTSGCKKCGGLGRLFAQRERERGIRCLACNSSGRVTHSAKARWQAVAGLVNAALYGMRDAGQEFPFKRFCDLWHPRYYRFIDILRAMDKRIVENLDFGWAPSGQEVLYSDSEGCCNSPIELSPQEQDHIGEDERAVGDSGCPTVHEPAVTQGLAPPQET